MDPKPELIERLKHNENPYHVLCDMDEEERTVISWAKNRGILQYLMSMNHDGVVKWSKKKANLRLYPLTCYRIDPAYQPEPETIDCEINKFKNRVLYHHSPDGWRTLWQACCGEYPNFVGYFYKVGAGNLWIKSNLEDIHAKYREGFSCVVRFLK